LFLLIGAFLTACGVSIHHYFQESAFILDLVIPPTLAIYLLGTLAYIAKYPSKVSGVIQPLIFVAIFALCVPAWYYSLFAFRSDQHTLLEILPPITPIIFPLALAIVAFLKPHQAPAVFLVTWLIFSAPILAYLMTHSSELSSPRGIEIAVTLGPIMLSVIALLLTSQRLKQEVLQLYDQKSDLKTIAEQDVLTGLLNRRAGQELLRKALKQTDSYFGLIMFDIDRFKSVNDEHGHDVGDKTLQDIVQRCKSRVRLHDFFIRWGGEEFMLILPDANLDETIALAEELRVLIAAKPLSNGLVSAASFGGTIRHGSDDTDSLFKRVDEALYEAKNSGRNKVVSKV
jgi:diguanylate cyclase (GGDEF)-like protein